MLNKVHVLNANILSRITASGLPIQEVCLLHPLWTEPHQGCLPPRFLPPRPRVQWEIQTPGSLNSTHWVGSSLKVKTALSLFTDASPVPRAVPGTLPVMYHCIFLDSVCVCSITQFFPTLRSYGLWPARFLCPWNFPGKNTGMGCQFLYQGIFSTQGSKMCLLHLWHWQVDSFTAMPLWKFPYFSEINK